MSEQGCNRLHEKLYESIIYITSEYDMTTAEIVGCLECVKHKMLLVGDKIEGEDEEKTVGDN